MIVRMLLTALIFAYVNVFALNALKSDTLPKWIDTSLAVVSIQPKQSYHNSLFHITFVTGKQSTVWFRVVSPGQTKAKSEMEVYRTPFTVMEEGMTKVYFQGENILGNKSKIDSMVYYFDTKQPTVAIKPESGRYRTPVTVRIFTDKVCRYSLLQSLIDTIEKPISDSFLVKDSLSGYVVCIDQAGNKTISKKMVWVVDSSSVRVDVSPKEGIYNSHKEIVFTSTPKADVYFSFDPSAPSAQFNKYDKKLLLPYGNTLLRYFAKTASGKESDILRATYVVDTVPPKLVFSEKNGNDFDTLSLSTKKISVIHYTLDGSFPTEASPVYQKPVAIIKKGKCIFKAIAKDLADNKSALFEWTFKYDKNPPQIIVSKQSGVYAGPFSLTVSTSKPASIYYTFDGSAATEKATLYKDRIQISKEGQTIIRFIAVDDAGNESPELECDYTIDSKPPFVRARIEEDVRQNAFLISLLADEPSTIYYELGGATPTTKSPVFDGKIVMRIGQVMQYMAIDKAGNKSEIKLMDELKKPIVTVSPEGGLYNKPVKIQFRANDLTQVYYWFAPDTLYAPYKDSLVLNKEGTYTLEYYSESQNGLSSPIRRSEYVLDLSPPQTDVIVKKGIKDSVSVFFECSKNATIYYTLDGTNPYYSRTARTAANKLLTSKDRISIKRSGDVKLAFYAEDAAGNQSPLRVLDVFKPRAIPDIPFGKDRVYDKVLSVNLNTFDSKSVVYYGRHGHVPTTDSSAFIAPITLVSSDTILAFVVDAAGYKGQIDTFVYLIDLPPTPEFIVATPNIRVGHDITFDASQSIDLQTAKNALLFRWDFNGDGKWDSQWNNNPIAIFKYPNAGLYNVILEVKDNGNHVARLAKEILVQELCPSGMVARARSDGSPFCIDEFEWPNIAGELALTSVSWVQAKMYCLDAGKRLCTQEEWILACKGSKKMEYPYGVKYEKGKCPTEGSAVEKSGKFIHCQEADAPKDMIGNVWEWVENKRGDYPVMMGGSFRFGEAADCDLASQGGVGLKSGEVGFRCCK